jgi:hypothetical protein
MVTPQASRTWAITSGFSGSPALTASRSVTCHSRRSCWINMRHTVGGAQKVLTRHSTSFASSACGSKRP